MSNITTSTFTCLGAPVTQFVKDGAVFADYISLCQALKADPGQQSESLHELLYADPEITNADGALIQLVPADHIALFCLSVNTADENIRSMANGIYIKALKTIQNSYSAGGEDSETVTRRYAAQDAFNRNQEKIDGLTEEIAQLDAAISRGEQEVPGETNFMRDQRNSKVIGARQAKQKKEVELDTYQKNGANLKAGLDGLGEAPNPISNFLKNVFGE